MRTPAEFLRFAATEGRKLSEINPGSDEVALKPSCAIKAIELLSGSQVAVLGGDVLSDSSGKLSYVHENWYCEKMSSEAPLEFVRRSHAVANAFIAGLLKRNDPHLCVVLVHSELGGV
ncbi:MAG: hypothetical protein KF830_16065 [Planctomycetes bacterium]|nr:hypothetical protein [Planctomycetota bacterium]